LLFSAKLVFSAFESPPSSGNRKTEKVILIIPAESGQEDNWLLRKRFFSANNCRHCSIFFWEACLVVAEETLLKKKIAKK